MANTINQMDMHFLVGDIYSRLDYFRRARKLGGIVTVSMDQFERQGFGHTPQTAGNHLTGRGGITRGMTPTELSEIADHLDCVWAMNPEARLYYFIPKELMGEGEGR